MREVISLRNLLNLNDSEYEEFLSLIKPLQAKYNSPLNPEVLLGIFCGMLLDKVRKLEAECKKNTME